EDVFGDIENAIVRIRYSCSEDLNKVLNRRALEKALYDAGVYFVAEIKGEIERAADRLRDEGLTEAVGPVEAVRRWAAANDIEDAEAEELAAMAAELLEVA
ncbi:MAG TPA: hypothetical protein DEA44_15260, partial [Firmicutes bacterium]|nr:hypothetical protein [Bacillota bacterium]